MVTCLPNIKHLHTLHLSKALAQLYNALFLLRRHRQEGTEPELKSGSNKVFGEHVVKGKGEGGERGQEWISVLIKELISPI